MARPRLYAPGCAPSDLKDYHRYIPRPKSPKALAFDAGLKELCDLQLGKPIAQADLADYLGVTQQCICRIEKRAKKKLRARLAAIGVKALPGNRGLDLRSAMRGL